MSKLIKELQKCNIRNLKFLQDQKIHSKNKIASIVFYHLLKASNWNPFRCSKTRRLQITQWLNVPKQSQHPTAASSQVVTIWNNTLLNQFVVRKGSHLLSKIRVLVLSKRSKSKSKQFSWILINLRKDKVKFILYFNFYNKFPMWSQL